MASPYAEEPSYANAHAHAIRAKQIQIPITNLTMLSSNTSTDMIIPA
jgi:hypothetical protein